MINQPKLNLACGMIRVPGFFGIDIVKTDAVDAVMDLQEYPWGIASDSVEEIICNHYVEHIPTDGLAQTLKKLISNSDSWLDFQHKVDSIDPTEPNDGLIQFVHEVWRILKPGGKITIITPHFNSEMTWQDPTHRRAMTESTFFYFNRQWRINSNLAHYPITTDFNVTFAGYNFFPGMEEKTKEEKKFSVRHLTNFVSTIKIVLQKPVTLTK